jgi:superfamily II DNA or RNA helicase/very-short-patch-repair endonuclease
MVRTLARSLVISCQLDNPARVAYKIGVNPDGMDEKISQPGEESVPMIVNDPAITSRSSPENKIRFFRSLFRGREDIYPRRFESRKTGRAGYQPACGNEWVRGVCEKPKIKCSECRHQRFLPVTDEVIRWHLSGKDAHAQPFVAGVYPMLLDETCWFLAIDLDQDHWREDTQAVVDTCGKIGLPIAVERSRSGNGAHIWMFFNEAISARLARSLGSHVLTVTMDSRPDLGLRSYDRLFPHQDTLPKGGFGNLIALPLQHEPRQRGNSVFIDAAFEPHADQWGYLASIRKIERSTVEAIVREAERRGTVLGVRIAESDDEDERMPWMAPPSRSPALTPIAGPFPESLELVFADQIYIAKEGLPPALRNRLLRLAAFQNPEFYRAQAMRLPTYDKPRIIQCAEELPKHIGLPRGCLEEVRELLRKIKVEEVLRDERFSGNPLDVTFQGTLRPDQLPAAEAMSAHDTGILAATTAFGKTVLAAWLIAQRKVNALILVHRRALLEQWIERLSLFLGVPPKTIGRIGGGRKKTTGIIDVALVQSLVRNGIVDDRVGNYGHLVVDECHHLSAHSFEWVARRAKARFVTGLSATVTRKDGHHPIVFMQCGPIRYRVDARQQAAARPFLHHVVVRPTGFRTFEPPEDDVRKEFQRLYTTLITNRHRNELICADVLTCLREGRSPLVLTERTEHLDELGGFLASAVPHLICLRGGLRRKEIKTLGERLAAIPESEGRVILATGQYLGEGYDDSRLDTLFLTLPVSWRGTVAQYAGRLHRLHDGKREVRIYDYADLDVPMLSRMFDRRCRGYDAIGYKILLPASAVPGWPAEVPLPVDPEWKKDYAASVRRLIRDGVDVPLANLFVHAAARIPAKDTEGIVRARSASEAFFYRRLQSLPATADRFRLNQPLSIPFRGQATMEVDFLCTHAPVVIELDGAQHLGDPDAYRRDREKDALLQENGYHVLRFLAEDLSQQLDRVLDRVLRALAHSKRPEGPPMY